MRSWNGGYKALWVLVLTQEGNRTMQVKASLVFLLQLGAALVFWTYTKALLQPKKWERAGMWGMKGRVNHSPSFEFTETLGYVVLLSSYNFSPKLIPTGIYIQRRKIVIFNTVNFYQKWWVPLEWIYFTDAKGPLNVVKFVKFGIDAIKGNTSSGEPVNL